MSNFTYEKINKVWEKAKKVDGYDPKVYRQDVAGAWIQHDQYGKQGSFGWEIDHMLPEAKGGTDHLTNLQPLQWENNRTKDDNFPNYSTSVSSEGESYIRKEESWKFTDEFIAKLKVLYPNNRYL